MCFLSKDYLRSELQAIYVDKNHYVGTDAHILGIVKRPKKDGLSTGGTYDKNKHNFKYESYPNYKGILPKEYKYKSDEINVKNIVDKLYSANSIFKKFKKLSYGHFLTKVRFAKDLIISVQVEHLLKALQLFVNLGEEKVSFEATTEKNVLVTVQKPIAELCGYVFNNVYAYFGW